MISLLVGTGGARNVVERKCSEYAEMESRTRMLRQVLVYLTVAEVIICTSVEKVSKKRTESEDSQQ